jgi:hypothetical protein
MAKHHDNHGKSASVPGKGNASIDRGSHWEKHYKMSDVRDTNHIAGTEWNPKVANTRTTTHTKVNGEDH